MRHAGDGTGADGGVDPRSRVVQEGLSLRYSEQLFYSIVSRDGTLYLGRGGYPRPVTGVPFIRWFRMPSLDGNLAQRPDMKWRWQAAGFGVGHLVPEVDFTVWTFPYWFPTGLLTILSAWLLLSKPRPRPHLTPASPDHA